MFKQKIDQLEAGDQVVVDFGLGENRYRVKTVEKVTSTQITIDGVRYTKRTRVKVGESQYSRYPQAIATVDYDRLMTPEEAEERNQGVIQEKKVKAMAQKIAERASASRNLVPLGEDKLRQIMNLMEIE